MIKYKPKYKCINQTINFLNYQMKCIQMNTSVLVTFSSPSFKIEKNSNLNLIKIIFLDQTHVGFGQIPNILSFVVMEKFSTTQILY